MLDIVLDAFKSTVNNLMKLHFLPLVSPKEGRVTVFENILHNLNSWFNIIILHLMLTSAF